MANDGRSTRERRRVLGVWALLVMLAVASCETPIRATTASPPMGLTEHDVASAYLPAGRRVVVYAPPGAKHGSSVLYTADGQGTHRYAKVVDQLLAAGRIRPIVVVGVHSAAKVGELLEDDMRFVEYFPPYLRMFDSTEADARHEAHLRFVTEEVPHWAEQTLGVSSVRRDRAFLGYSNGGVFAGALAVSHPALFGTVIAFSMGSEPRIDLPWTDPPRIFTAAGTREAGNHDRTKKFTEAATGKGAKATFRSRECRPTISRCGLEELGIALTETFPPRGRGP